MSNLVPMVVEREGNSERSYDLYSRMMKDRIIFVTGPIETNMCQNMVAQLLYLESIDGQAPINMFINSPGGEIIAGMSVFDTMQFISCPVHTTVVGMAASMGSVLLMAGEPGHRCALPNSEILIHQPSGGARGQCSDIQIQAKNIQRLKEKLTREYVERCGKKVGKTYIDFEIAMDRDTILEPPEALAEWGLIDRVLVSRADVVVE